MSPKNRGAIGPLQRGRGLNGDFMKRHVKMNSLWYIGTIVSFSKFLLKTYRLQAFNNIRITYYLTCKG
jgi:hypothetical protein